MLELDPTLVCNGNYVVEGYDVPTEGVYRHVAILLCPGIIVDKYTAPRDALFCPVPDADAGGGRVQDFSGRGASVEDALVGSWARRVVVAETIPLGGLLGVKMVFIVESNAVSNPSDAVFEGFASEACVS